MPTSYAFGLLFGSLLTVLATYSSAGTARQRSGDGGYVARYIAAQRKGYHSRPCGFDANRNGVIGEAADLRLADGKTTDPDGDGVDEDIVYADAATGSDETGDGSPGSPFRTIAKAATALDGPDDGAEDIVCISGSFHETVTIPHGGVPGHYERDAFQFPSDPLMIVGWDRDGDGEYPPHDRDDVAVLDGRGTLAWAINSPRKLSFIEIAHLTIRDYGYQRDNCGALKLFRWGTGHQSHVYIHDVELHRINKGEKDASGKIVLNFWGGPMTWVAFANNLVNEYGSYFCRGAPPDNAGHFRFRGNTLRMFGTRKKSFVTGWKLWGHHRHVEILDNVIDCNAHAWRPAGHASGIGVCQGTQDWVIRGNVFIDTGVGLQPFAKGYPFQRRLDNILIDRNVFRATYDGWDWGRPFIHIQGHEEAPIEQTVEDVTITNNFFSGSVGYATAVLCNAGYGNAGEPGPAQPGCITIAGNTISGPFTRNGFGALTFTPRARHRQNTLVIQSNLITNTGPNASNVEVAYAPTNFIACGNLYDPDARFRWDETKHWIKMTFDEWQRATGQDADSKLGVPRLADVASGDLHLLPDDTLAAGLGADITHLIAHDFDGDPRSSARPVCGADVPGRPVPPAAKRTGRFTLMALGDNNAGDLALLSQRYDLMIASHCVGRDVIDAFRKRAPDGQVFRYVNTSDVNHDWLSDPHYQRLWNDTNPHEDWFHHGADGERVRIYYPKYRNRQAFDTGKVGLQRYLAGRVVEALKTGLYDGIQLDNVSTDFPFRRKLLGTWISSVPVRLTPEQWAADEVAMLKVIMGAVAAAGFEKKTIIFNHMRSGEPQESRAYVEVTDGANCESWLSRRTDPDGRWGWRAKVEQVGGVNRMGKLTNLLCVPKQLSEEEALFCFTSYLMALYGDRAHFFYGTNYKIAGQEHAWYPFYEVDIGEPVSQCGPRDGGFFRTFSKGAVAVNPTEVPVEMDLSRAYVTLAGRRVEKLPLPPKSGAILLTGAPRM